MKQVWQDSVASNQCNLTMDRTKLRELRRSTRVPLKVALAVESGVKRFSVEGETVVVNLHGALISTATALSVGINVSIHVYLTDKRAMAKVVYIDPENPLRCGIELDQSRNIWGVSLPPSNWEETAAFDAEHQR